MRRLFFSAALIGILIGVVFGFLPGRPIGQMPDNSPKISYLRTDDFVIMWDSLRGTARYAFPKTEIIFPTDSTALIQTALQFVDEHPELFGTNSGELRNPILTKRLGKYWLSFRQYYAGRYVYDGVVYFRVAGDGRLWACGSRAITQFDGANSPTLSADYCYRRAGEFVDKNIGQTPKTAPLKGQSRLVWFPVGGVGKLAYEFEIPGDSPDRFRIWVDAHTGEILGWTNLVNYYDVAGQVGIYYLPDFFDDPWSTGPFANGHISFNYVQSTATDTLGNYYIDAWIGGVYQPLRSWLDGLYVNVDLMSGGSDAIFTYYLAPPDTYNWTWTDDMAQPDELNLYYHTDFIHSWYKHLDPEMTGLDYPVPARARVPDMPENAYWDGYGTNYGAGGEFTRNFALFANVIYHEYTHGVTGWIYRDFELPYTGEAGAINEAFSDYFACTITDYPYSGWRVSRDDSYFRNLENDYHYPEDIIGEPHADSRIISGAFWEIRQGLYPDRKGWADSLIHFTRYSCANTFNDFAIECFFTADDDGNISNGCENLALIANSFARHGLGPGYYPTLTVLEDSVADLGDGDNYLESGEEFSIIAKIAYYNEFPYPPVNNLCFYTEFSDSSAVPLEPTATVGTLANGDTAIVIFQFSVADSLVPHYVNYSIFYGTPELPLTKLYENEIALGHPQVLLVNNSGTEDYTHYYTESLKEIPVVYDYIFAPESLDYPDIALLSEFNVVLWFTGDAKNSINEYQRGAIAEYISSSTAGNPHYFILTGQDGFDGPEYSGFLAENFSARVSEDSVRAIAVNGVEGDTLGDGFNMMIFGAAGANNQHSPSALETTDPYGTVFALYHTTENSPAAIRHHRDTQKTVILGYGLEATGPLAGINIDLLTALKKILEWFEIPIYSGITEGAPRPEAITVCAYPNPFNSAVRFDVETAGKFSLEIYDIAGKKVFGTTGTGTKSVIWQPDNNLGSGIYLYRLHTAEKDLTGKVIYLR